MAHQTKEKTLKEKKKEKKLAKTERENFEDAIKLAGSTELGRLLLWEILGKSHCIGGSLFNPNALTQSYIAGKRDLGNWLLDEILQIDEEIFLKMMTERKKGE